MNTEKILITGGCGFIGTNFVRHMLAEDDRMIVNLDKLTYAGCRENLADVEDDPRYTFIQGDIADTPTVTRAMEGVAAVINIAAETHVDRSIQDPAEFVKTNVLGTYTLLEAAMRAGVKKFVQVSTDEVYGSLGPEGRFCEDSPLAPNSPYAASKASADMLARSYFKTYGFPAVITRCSNNYGPYQYPEKLIPLMLTRALQNEKLPVYGDGMNVRDWLYVDDHCRALKAVLGRGGAGEVYNIGGNNEWHNIDIVKLLLKKVGKPEGLIEYVKDRLGHDRRYAIDASKIKKDLGWEPAVGFEEGMERTVNYFRKADNQ